MAIVTFEAPGEKPLTVNAKEGGTLGDLCDASSAPIPFSCRSATCGTCRLVVLEGANELLPPEEDELDLLDVFGATPDKQRLACQAKIRPGEGKLRVRPVTDQE